MQEEIFDIVNDQDMVIGQATRSEAHESGLQHRGVHVFLFTVGGRMLVQQRSKTRHASPSSLDCSVTEHVQAGEDYLTAAKRGLDEELGLHGIPLEPIITFRMNYGPNDNEISRLFQGSLADPRLVHFETEEVERVEYASLEELRRLLEEGNRPFSRWFAHMILWAEGKPSDLQILEVHGKLRNDQ